MFGTSAKGKEGRDEKQRNSRSCGKGEYDESSLILETFL
jgi:hypothetical protein